MDEKKSLKKVEKTTNELLELMGFDLDKEIELLEDSRGNKYFKVTITSENVGLLIGHGGETLKSFQTILSLMLAKEDPDIRVVVDVNDYQKKKEESLQRMLDYKIRQMQDRGETEIDLFPMEANQRRIVHEYVATISGLTSTSEGEGADRRVIITME